VFSVRGARLRKTVVKDFLAQVGLVQGRFLERTHEISAVTRSDKLAHLAAGNERIQINVGCVGHDGGWVWVELGDRRRWAAGQRLVRVLHKKVWGITAAAKKICRRQARAAALVIEPVRSQQKNGPMVSHRSFAVI
jgi:hypothetical protein